MPDVRVYLPMRKHDFGVLREPNPYNIRIQLNSHQILPEKTLSN